MVKHYLGIGLAALILVVGIGWAGMQYFLSTTEIHDHATHDHSDDEEYRRGVLSFDNEFDYVINPDNPISVVVYSDSDCPFCQKQMERIANIIKQPKYASEVSVTVRHALLPIYESYPEAKILECVGQLTKSGEKYFNLEMDFLGIKTTGDHRPESLLRIAEAYASRSEIKSCIENEETMERVHTVVNRGRSIGVSTLPHTFIFAKDGGAIYEMIGSKPESQILSFIDLAISGR